MRNELKRLMMGFIYSLMTFSFIMAPIPFIGFNNAYAEGLNTERTKIYKKGDNVDEIVQTTEMKNYTDESEGFKGIIHQAVVGLMGVVLIESLRYKYRHDLRPEVYGNDCKPNTAAKWTMRISQFGALMYILGDVSANMQFQKAAKAAADSMEEGALSEFNPQEKTNFENMSDEEKEAWEEANEGKSADSLAESNQQVAGFNKLIEILEGQEKALETKKTMNTVAALAYTASTGIEVAKMIQCGIKCGTDRGKKLKDATLVTTSITTAITAATSAASTATAMCATVAGCASDASIAAASCGSLAATLGGLTGKFATNVGKEVADTTKATTEQAARDGIEFGKWIGGVLQSIGDWFNLKVQETAGGAQDLGSRIDGMQQEADTEEARMAAENAQRDTSLTTNLTADGTFLGGALTTQAIACGNTSIGASFQVGSLVKTALSNYVNYRYAPVQCCGSNGMHSSFRGIKESGVKSLEGIVDSIPGAVLSMKQVSGIQEQLGEGGSLIEDGASEKAVEQAQQQIQQGVMSQIGGLPGVNDIMSKGTSAEMGMSQISGNEYGILLGYGVPLMGNMMKKDIYVHDTFKKFTSQDLLNVYNDTPVDEDTRYWILNTFETRLRKFVLNKQLGTKFDSPREEIEFVAKHNKQVDNIMYFFEKILQEESPNKIILGEYKTNRYYNLVTSMMSNLLVPKAHAFLGAAGGMLGGAGGSLLIGMGCNMVKGMINGPFVAVLNLGCQFVMLRGLLGKVARNYGFVSPLGRSITWGIMTALAFIVKKWDEDALEKVKERIAAIEEERTKYINSSARKGTTAGSKFQGGNFSANNYEANSRNGGQAFIKQCAVATGQSFKPASCPTKSTKSSFDIEKPDKLTAQMVGPESMSSLPMVSQLSAKTANGSLDGSDLSDSKLADIERRTAAIAKRNAKLIDDYDKMVAKANKNRKNKPSSLKDIINQTKNAISGASGAVSGSTPAFASTSPSTIRNNNDAEESGVVGPTGNKAAAGGGGVGVPAAGGFDLDLLGDDFADDGTGAGDAAGDGATAAKAEENLGDFELNHDDINKRKEVSIFKILSNRYILSYPKVLEEEMMVSEPEAKAEETKSLESQLDEVKQ